MAWLQALGLLAVVAIALNAQRMGSETDRIVLAAIVALVIGSDRRLYSLFTRER